MRRWSKNRIYDTLHRGFVYTSVSFTAVTTLYLMYKGVTWWLYTRPARLEMKRTMLEQKMADEQDKKEQELYGLQQKEAETMK